MLLTGESSVVFPPLLQDQVNIDASDEQKYFVKLLDLIWRLYGLPFDDPLLEELRGSVSPRIPQTIN